MNEKLHSFRYLFTRTMEYSTEQLDASINRLKNLKNDAEKSNLAGDNTLDKAITDVESRLSRVLALLNRVKASDDNLLEWDNLLKKYDDA